MMSKESSKLSIRNCIFGFQCQKSWQDMEIIRPSFNESVEGGKLGFAQDVIKKYTNAWIMMS